MAGRSRIRTDLALETTERFQEENVEVHGVEIQEKYDAEKDVRTTVVRITTENGARTMGKPQGTYITIEAPDLSVPDEDYHREISEEVAHHLRELIDLGRQQSVLVVGLGNQEITADSLGPRAVSGLHMTRHVIREYGLKSNAHMKMHQISGIAPGVMAQTGMETLEIVQGVVSETKPDVVIIDSIQTMYSQSVEGTPGSLAQIRENTSRLMTFAKSEGIPVVVIGHVTKDGAIAGPRMMEHMVDVVLYFEGERNYQFRILRGIKNRFGSTNESGLFTMTSSGLSELENPSQLLLAERAADQAGSAVAAVLDGMRPMLGEIQALTAHSVFAVPRRTASGMDYNRLIILLAVQEKRLGVPLGSQDVYINVVGGLRLTETAADLPVALAVYSSLRDISMDSRTVVMGEVGLTGDIRRVPQALRRIKEAAKMGFNTFILPKGNLEDIETDQFPDCHFLGVATLREAIEKAFRR